MKCVKQHQAPSKKLIVTMPPGVLHKMQLICMSMALETRATVWLQTPWSLAGGRPETPGQLQGGLFRGHSLRGEFTDASF